MIRKNRLFQREKTPIKSKNLSSAPFFDQLLFLSSQNKTKSLGTKIIEHKNRGR